MSRNASLRWLALALAGLLIAAAVAYAGARLASRQIGLASEPIRAGNALAPPDRDKQPRATPQGKADEGSPTRPSEPAEEASPLEESPPAAEAPSVTPAPAQQHEAEGDGDRDRDD